MATQNQGQGQTKRSGTENRGFASMSAEEQREIARMGGEAVSEDREHMAAIGRKGGEASAEARAAARSKRAANLRNQGSTTGQSGVAQPGQDRSDGSVSASPSRPETRTQPPSTSATGIPSSSGMGMSGRTLEDENKGSFGGGSSSH